MPLGLTRIAMLASFVLLGGTATALSGTPPIQEALRGDQGMLLEIKTLWFDSSKWQFKNDCCKACVKREGEKKSCKLFCGKQAKDKCDAYEKGGGGGGKPPELKLEDAPCYPICSDQCGKTRGSLTFEQCVIDCLNRTRCSD